MELKAFVINQSAYASGEFRGEWLHFPTTQDTVRAMFDRIGFKPDSEYMITDYDCDVDAVIDRLGEHESLDGLNYLAMRVNELDEDGFEKWKAVIDFETELEDMINDTYNLDAYELLSGVSNEEEYGLAIVRSNDEFDKLYVGDMNMVDYLDLEAIGRDTAINESGRFVEAVYIRKIGYTENVWDYKMEIPEEYRISGGQNLQELPEETQTTLQQDAQELLAEAQLQTVSLTR